MQPILYDKNEVKFIANKCVNCVNYSWEDKHICNDVFSDLNVGKHEIYCDTIHHCLAHNGYEEKIENWWMVK